MSEPEEAAAMAMGPERGQGATLQLEMVSVDQLVPEDDLYRRIDALVDWGFVRSAAAAYYAEALGRPSLDPVVLCKLMLAGALEGVGSMRELLRVASLRVDLRRFLGYGLGERLPVHQTVSDGHSRRFLDGVLFESLLARTVALCREQGLLEGTHLSVDGFHLEANAALESMRASLHSLAALEEEAPSAPTAASEPTVFQPLSEEATSGDVGSGSGEPARVLGPAGPRTATSPPRPAPPHQRPRSHS
ncbi:MAG: transposase, partial [Gaiellaceae bacterium]